jgi:hypothetical protein
VNEKPFAIHRYLLVGPRLLDESGHNRKPGKNP